MPKQNKKIELVNQHFDFSLFKGSIFLCIEIRLKPLHVCMYLLKVFLNFRYNFGKKATCLAFFSSLPTKVIEDVVVRHVMHCLWYVIQDKFGERREKKSDRLSWK